jgi:hypothetical protein
MFRWLLNMLEKADKHALEWDVIQSALELDFVPEEAENQVEVAVNWGRYAELLAYDDGKATIYLETTTKGQYSGDDLCRLKATASRATHDLTAYVSA